MKNDHIWHNPPGGRRRMVALNGIGSWNNWFGKGVVMAANSRVASGFFNYHRNSEFLRVYMIKSAVGRFRWGKQSGIFQPGEVVVMPAGVTQLIDVDRTGDIMAWILDERRFHSAGFQHRAFKGITAYDGLMTRLYDEFMRINPERKICEPLCEVIVQSLRRDFFNAATGGAGAHAEFCSRLDWMLVQVSQHPEEDWTVERMAGQCGLSTSHFFALTRKCFNASPARLLMHIRMKLASQLLLEPGSSVKQVAATCGYSRVVSFSRAFKHFYGESASEFRRRQKILANGEIMN